MWSWGKNASGQLGLGNITDYSSPKQIGALTTWATLSAAYTRVLAIKTDGTMWTWGAGSFGQLGLGNTTSYSSPKQIGALTTWSKASCTLSYSTLAVKTDGTMWSWGLGGSGQLGLGNTTSYSSPKQIGALTGWSAVAASYQFSAAIRTNGTLWMWGQGSYGRLGLGNTTSYSSPKQIGALTGWSTVAIGMRHTLALKT
jgi:alpha-tubulin suppressor-like RCC1 family protein